MVACPEVLDFHFLPLERPELGDWDINTAKVGGLFLSRWLTNEDLLSCDRGTLAKKVLQERKEARWVPTAPCLSSQSLYWSPKQGGGWGMGLGRGSPWTVSFSQSWERAFGY